MLLQNCGGDCGLKPQSFLHLQTMPFNDIILIIG